MYGMARECGGWRCVAALCLCVAVLAVLPRASAAAVLKDGSGEGYTLGTGYSNLVNEEYEWCPASRTPTSIITLSLYPIPGNPDSAPIFPELGSLCIGGKPMLWSSNDTAAAEDRTVAHSGADAKRPAVNSTVVEPSDMYSSYMLPPTMPSTLPWPCVEKDDSYVVLYFCNECSSVDGIASLRDFLFTQSSEAATAIKRDTGKVMTYVFLSSLWINPESVQHAFELTGAQHAILQAMSTAAKAVIKSLPEYNFTVLHFDTETHEVFPNAELLVVSLREMGFEAGVLAGLLTVSGVVCSVAEDMLSDAFLGVYAGLSWQSSSTVRLVNMFVDMGFYSTKRSARLDLVTAMLDGCDVLIVIDRHTWSPLMRILASPDLPQDHPLRKVVLISIIRLLYPLPKPGMPRVITSVAPIRALTGLVKAAVGQFTGGVRYAEYMWMDVASIPMPILRLEEFLYGCRLYRLGALTPVYGALEMARQASPSPLFINVAEYGLGNAKALSPSMDEAPIACDVGARVFLFAGDFSHMYVFSAATNEHAVFTDLLIYDYVNPFDWREQKHVGALEFRTGATCTSIDNSTAIIHGGITRDGRVLNETFLVTTARHLPCRKTACHRCTIPVIALLPELPGTGGLAPPRFNHTAVVVERGAPAAVARHTFARAGAGGAVTLGVPVLREVSVVFMNGLDADGPVSRVSWLVVTPLLTLVDETAPSWLAQNVHVATPHVSSAAGEPADVDGAGLTGAASGSGGSSGLGASGAGAPSLLRLAPPVLADASPGAHFHPSFAGYMGEDAAPVAYDRTSAHVFSLEPAASCGGAQTAPSAASSAQCFEWVRISAEAMSGNRKGDVACVLPLSGHHMLTAIVNTPFDDPTLYRFRRRTGTWVETKPTPSTEVGGLCTVVFGARDNCTSAEGRHGATEDDNRFVQEIVRPKVRVCVGMPYPNGGSAGAFLLPAHGNNLADTLYMDVKPVRKSCAPGQVVGWDFASCEYCSPDDAASSDGFCDRRVVQTSPLKRHLLPVIIVSSLFGVLGITGVAALCCVCCYQSARRDLMWDRASNPKNAPLSGQTPIAAVRISPEYFEGREAGDCTKHAQHAQQWRNPLLRRGRWSCEGDGDDDGDVGEQRMNSFKVAVDVFSEHVCAAVEAHKCFLLRFTGDSAMFVAKDPHNVLAAATDLSIRLASLGGGEAGPQGGGAMPLKCGLHYAYVAQPPTRKSTKFIYSGTLAEECAKLMMAARAGVLVASDAFYQHVDQSVFDARGLVIGDTYDLPLARVEVRDGAAGLGGMGAERPPLSPWSGAPARPHPHGGLERSPVRDLVVKMVEQRFRRVAVPARGAGGRSRTASAADEQRRRRQQQQRQLLSDSYLSLSGLPHGRWHGVSREERAGAGDSELVLAEAQGELLRELATAFVRAAFFNRALHSTATKRTRALVAERFQLPVQLASRPLMASALAARLVAIADVRDDVRGLQAAAAHRTDALSVASSADTRSESGSLPASPTARPTAAATAAPAGACPAAAVEPAVAAPPALVQPAMLLLFGHPGSHGGPAGGAAVMRASSHDDAVTLTSRSGPPLLRPPTGSSHTSSAEGGGSGSSRQTQTVRARSRHCGSRTVVHVDVRPAGAGERAMLRGPAVVSESSAASSVCSVAATMSPVQPESLPELSAGVG